MAADTNKQCTITNNSGKDFLLTLAIPQDEIANNGGTIAANGQLEVLTTTDGNTILKNNNSVTFTLDHSYKPGGEQTGYVKDYELVAGDTTWLYPLGIVHVVQTDSNGTVGFSPMRIDASIATGIAQAAKFCQAISAYAETQLISDYTNALEATKAAKTAEEIAATMNAFFKSTADYKDVTLAEMSAIQDYYNNFPAVWAEYKDDLTYYLYGSDGTVASFQGTVSLKKSGPLDPLKPAGGYSCTFTPATNPTDTSVWDLDASKQVALSYSDGMFVTGKTAGEATVTLKGNFLLKSFFTNQVTDDSIVLVLCGNVNGIVCVGFDQPQASATSTAAPSEAGSAQDFWDSLIHPKSQLEIGISVAVFCGAVALLGGIVRAVYAVYKSASATNSTPKVAEAMDGEINKANDRARNLLGENAPEQKPYIIRDSQHAAQIARDTLRAGQMIEAFERQKWAARGILELSPEVLGKDAVTALQQCLTDGRESTAKLNQASLDDLRKTIDIELPKLGIIQAQLKTLQMDTGDQLSDKNSAELDRNLKTGDELIKSVNDSISYENKEQPELDFVFIDKEPY